MYSPKEEFWNVFSHGSGLALSILAVFLLLERACDYSNLALTLSFGVFGISLVVLYAASTFYHSAKDPKTRFKLKIFDHIAIFILIAGTYTPFSVVTLQGSTGWTILGVAWGIAFIGTMLKIFFTGRFKILSTLLYVGMGWIIVFAISPLLQNLSMAGLWWLFAGGMAYTLGAILYNVPRIKYNHAIFHVFVLLGSFCHFMSIYNHVIPAN
ncbi:PAQR family membrane homeostasis protein TrhA [Salinimicrobium soli]|uniref:PAQR family membrane homeostasis protein TrhA n=1 Tax=Salinimicrobium soli TaxID=1254399 RepID=UPI003AAE8DDB